MTTTTEIQKTVEQYGWNANADDNGTIYLSNRNNRTVCQVIQKNGKYKVLNMAGDKLMTGNAVLTTAIEKLLTQFYYAQKQG